MKTARARELRSDSSKVERLLWTFLRRHALDGFKFRRQQPIGPFIVDFVCFEKRLVIELDGGQHAEQKNYDDSRSRWLVQRGYRVRRFWNNEVLGQLEIVLDEIFRELKAPLSPTLPLKGGGSKSSTLSPSTRLSDSVASVPVPSPLAGEG